MVVKQDVYNLLKQKEIELCETKLKPLKEKKDNLQKAVIDTYFVAKGINLDEVVKAIKESSQVASTIRDDFEIHWGTINRISDEHYNDADELKKDIINRSTKDWAQQSPELYEIEQEYVTLRDALGDEFRKLNALVKANSAKQSVKILKELGFDTSDIENQTAKKEVMILQVNTSLLDLPESVEEAEGGSSDES